MTAPKTKADQPALPKRLYSEVMVDGLRAHLDASLRPFKPGDSVPPEAQFVIEAGGCLHIADFDDACQSFYFKDGARRHYVNGVARAWMKS